MLGSADLSVNILERSTIEPRAAAAVSVKFHRNRPIYLSSRSDGTKLRRNPYTRSSTLLCRQLWGTWARILVHFGVNLIAN